MVHIIGTFAKKPRQWLDSSSQYLFKETSQWNYLGLGLMWLGMSWIPAVVSSAGNYQDVSVLVDVHIISITITDYCP
jgi:hypothetical protein